MPITDEKTDDVTRVRRLIREASMARASFIEQAERNDAMFLGRIMREDVPLRGHNYLLINKTGQAILTHVQIMLESRPRRRINARETSTEPELWMTRKALRSVQSAIERGVIQSFDENEPTDDMGLLEDETVATEPEGFDFKIMDETEDDAYRVSNGFVTKIMPLFQPFTTADGEERPPVLQQSDLMTLDDSMTAGVVQNNMDIEWDKNDWDAWLTDNVVNTKKFGMQPAMFAWDKERQCSTLFDIHIKNIYLPKNCTGVRDAEYVIVREFVSKEEGKERWPHAASAIDKQADTNEPGGDDTPWQGVEFDRNMVWVWHVFIRNHRYPMSPDDALDMGRVVLKGDQFFLTDDEFEVTDQAVVPGEKGWPKQSHIRQMQFIGVQADLKVSDQKCPYSDIPVLLNRNIPISYQPFGQGEPERLWFIQKMIDKLSSIIIDHLTYYRSPQQIYPLSVYKKLKNIEKLHSYPGRDAYLEDGVFEQYRDFLSSGKGFTVETPKLTTTGYVNLWQMAMGVHDDLSGNVGVLQGKAPGANSSGRVVEELQTSARGLIGFGSAQLEKMLKQLTRLQLEAHRKWLPLRSWEKWNDSVPTSMLAAIRRRSRNMDLDMEIEVVSGGGQIRQQRKQEAISEVAAGLRSPQSYRRLAEIESDDPDWQPQVPQGG